MDIRELEKLGVWYAAHFDRFAPLYQGVISPIQHNATQPQKLAVEEPLNDLIKYLRRMDFESLSIEQIKLLDKLGVSTYLGHEGAHVVDSIVRTGNYDPNTASTQLNEAYGKLSNARTYLDSFLQSLNNLELRDQEDGSDFITIRVSFQNEASITNVSQWKRSSADWYDIIRGIAMINSEAPEATKVIGATKGSIILILAATAGVTALLAKIAKDITTTAKDILEVENSREDLKQKKMLTKVMADELDRLAKEKKENTVAEIVGEFKHLVAGGAGDKLAALTKSVEKLLAFNEKGGTVDFVMPENFDEDEDEVQAAAPLGLAAAKKAIQDYQEVREQVKLLSYHEPANDE
ncbi:MAG TPA: hypothetical protein VMQ93_15715 [Novosphingobium sp.]|nr:hypothetical protein [Novosphingobium sp.]